MRPITEEMIKTFKINKLGYDMMGGTFKKKQELSYHHTIVPKRECKRQGLGEGYYFWNGSILVQNTSHDELHKLEMFRPKQFAFVTSELIDMNICREIKLDNLKRIREILLDFEYKYRDYYTKGGHKLIKPEYISNRIKL